MSKNADTPIIQDGDAEVTGQLQAGTVAVQNRVLAEINSKLAVDGQVLVTEAQRNAMNGYAGLDANGKLLAAVLPEISISRVFVVATQAAQLALTADEGDLAIRSDQSRSYVHTGGTTGTMADWLELARTSDHVYSVAGKVGAVELNTNDIGGLSTALSGKANTAHNHTLSDVTNAGTAASKDAPSTGDASSGQVVLGSDTRLSDSRTPTAHTHSISDVTNLQTSLDGKSATAHTHTTSDITNAGTAISKDAPASGDATSGQVVLGSDTRLSDARTPTPHSHQISDTVNLQTALDGKAASSHTHTLSAITDAGSAASRSVPTSGNATSGQVVLGSDTRLTDSRTPNAHKTSHTYSSPLNETQVLYIPNNGSGSFTLTFKNETTAPITLPATAASIESALRALPSIGGDTSGLYQNITVFSGDMSSISTFFIEFVNSMGYRWQPLITSNGTNISGGGSIYLQTSAPTGSIVSPSWWINSTTKDILRWSGTAWVTYSYVDNLGDLEQSSTFQRKVLTSNYLKGTLGPNGPDQVLAPDIGAAALQHSHSQTEITGLTSALSGKVDSTDSRLTNSRTPTTHKSTHATGGSDALTASDIGAAASSHTHAISDVTNLQTSLDGKAASSHTHAISDVTNLQTSLDGKAASSHTHTISQVTDAGSAASKNAPTSGNATSGEVVLGSDTRLTDSRTPTAHKTSHATGGTDALTASDIGAMSSTALTRQSTTTSVTVAAGAEASISLTLATAFTIWKLETDKAARIRLYSTSAARTSDTSRASGTAPDAGNGLITEVITTSGLLAVPMSPPQQGANLDTTPSSTIYALIRNDGATSNVSLTLTWTKEEV